MKTELESQTIHAFVDGEFNLEQQLAMETRLADDPALRAEVESARRLRDTVREHADYHAAPAGLRHRLQALGQPVPVAAKPRVLPRWLAWQNVGLSLAVACLLTWGVLLAPWSLSRDDALMQEVVASHVRATLGQRLVDVASSDHHTVKPWLSSRLDFSPPVHDLHEPNVAFIGGRIDYLDNHPVATLVYKHGEHVADAFIWPTHEPDSPMRSTTQRGFNATHWTHGGMRYWLVSDLSANELTALAWAIDRGEGSR